MADPARPEDQAIRDEVIDPGRSFVVQAPAGSGKTELLTRRFLRLLATVRRPQQVLAITFTRKATREMADRVLARLRGAAAGRMPDAPHERQAHELALAVLARDAEAGWNLLDDPSQLQIHTIDGLCARLAARGGGEPLALAGLAVAEHPLPLYREAARQTLEAAARAEVGAPVRQALEDLLLRERGNANRLQDLLAEALPRRDQWLESVVGANEAPDDLLARHQSRTLEGLEAALGREALEAAGEALIALAPLADAPPPDDPLPRAWAELAQNDTPAQRTLAYWAALSRLASSKHQPYAKSSLKRYVYPGNSPERDALLERLGPIVEAWRDSPRGAEAFTRFVKAPPLGLSGGEARLLDDLRRLLTEACAHLHVQFAESGICDFQHVAQLALQALGDEDAPGEALLIEDGRLEHVLVDEFQDTSQLQYDLVRLLTAGWTPGDGRSLFLVGDPMQSIYRFRKADVGLFRDVIAQERIGEVPLACRTLSVNFRSTATLIEDVNATCAGVFTAPSPGAPGHVDYTPVQPFHGPGGTVETAAFEVGEDGAGEAAEARWIAGRIARLVDRDGTVSVGVLARKRKQLEPVARALVAQGVTFEAVEVESLAQRPVVLDLLTLTRALSHPGDRVAWLGLLLAPWCALQPRELLQVAGPDNTADGVERCLDPEVIAPLAPAVRERVRRTGEALAAARAVAGSASLCERVEASWVRLGGPRVARSPADLDDAEVFLELLGRLEREAPEDLPGLLTERLDKLYAGSRPAPVKLMTVHKAKGLEFDAVFLPGLQGKAGGAARPLFRQQDLRLSDGRPGSLLAPLKSTGDNRPTLYDHLALLAREEEESETQRLLYVAMTRARRHLFLSACCARKKDGRLSKASGTFLELLRPRFEAIVAEQDRVKGRAEEPVETGVALEARTLPRLAQAAPIALEVSDGEAGDATPVTLGAEMPDRERLALGEALHHWLELVHDHWSDRWTGDWYEDYREALEASLALAGAPRKALPDLRVQLEGLLRGLLADERVRAMLAPGDKHRSLAEAEYLVPRGRALVRRIIDRLYQDLDGAWHVVDYKTGADLADTRVEWRRQLTEYAETVGLAEDGEVADALVLRAGDNRFIDPDG